MSRLRISNFDCRRNLPSPKTRVLVRLEAPLSTRFSIRNSKSEAVFERLVVHFFFIHHWIQLAKFHLNGARKLNPKMSNLYAHPYYTPALAGDLGKTPEWSWSQFQRDCSSITADQHQQNDATSQQIQLTLSTGYEIL
jgi:hypothetical protein